MGNWSDRLGTVASSVCAVHCAMCALLPFAFGIVGLGFLQGPIAEWVFTLLAVLFGLVAMFLGWRVNRSPLVTGLFLVGIFGLFAARGLEMGTSHHHDHGGDHHDVHEDAHAADHHDAHDNAHANEHHDAPKDAHKEDAHHAHEAEKAVAHHEEAGHDDHEGDFMHSLGALVGVLSGMFLVIGHVLNIRAARRRVDGCEPPGPALSPA